MNIEKLQNNLALREIGFAWFETAAEASAYLASRISGRTVGIGGSKTVETMGLYEKLYETNTVAWHWRAENAADARARACGSKVYISSANGLSETGEIVNIDGSCNRLTGTMYHTREVYYVVGVNKVRPTLDAAIWRARNVAAPLNARRFAQAGGPKTPCAEGELKCHDCKSPHRICREILITCMKPVGMDKMEIVVVNEDLGY